jgi:hypothetical protein
MADKNLALGSVVKVDHDADATYTVVGNVTSVTPPGRKRVRVDQTALADTLKTYALGIEDFSEFTFAQYWDPGDTNHEIIDTLFGNNTDVNWQCLYGSAPIQTDQFSGKVSDMTPGELTTDGMIMRTVTVQRTGAITRS